jgi:hypothetical protein
MLFTHWWGWLDIHRDPYLVHCRDDRASVLHATGRSNQAEGDYDQGEA